MVAYIKMKEALIFIIKAIETNSKVKTLLNNVAILNNLVFLERWPPK